MQSDFVERKKSEIKTNFDRINGGDGEFIVVKKNSLDDLSEAFEWVKTILEVTEPK